MPKKAITKLPGTYIIRLPRLFEQMTDPDTVTILEWHVREGDIVQPDAPLVKVEALQDIYHIPLPPYRMIRVPHRVVKIARAAGSTIYLHDLLIVLEPAEYDVAA